MLLPIYNLLVYMPSVKSTVTYVGIQPAYTIALQLWISGYVKEDTHGVPKHDFRASRGTG